MMIRVFGAAALVAMTVTSGQAQTTATPLPSTDAVPFDPEMVDRVFSRLPDHERFVIQARLQRRDFYQGTVDGLTGPGTRAALQAQAAALIAAGQNVELDTAPQAGAFLSGLLPLPPEELPEGDAFFGTWDCQGSAWTYGYDGFTNGARTSPLRYMTIQELTPSIYSILYMDGYETGLLDVTPTTMTWFSPESGDSFDCRRVSGPPPRPETGAVDPPLVGEQVEAVPPAPPEVDTAQPSQPETKPTPTPVAPVSEAISWAFEGRWSCTSETFEGQTRFEFGADAVTVPAFGTTVGYADVTPIGGRETAFLVNLRDGQQAGLAEIEPGRMILFAAGSLFDCARET